MCWNTDSTNLIKLFYNLGWTTSLWLHFWELIEAEVTQCLSLTKVSHCHWLCQDLQKLCLAVCLVALYLWAWNGIFHPAPCWDLFALWVKAPLTCAVKNIPSQMSFMWAPPEVSRVFTLSKQTFSTNASTLKINQCTTRVEVGSVGSFQSSTKVVGWFQIS